MKMWKSPVFYFGIVLLAAITLALAAPFIMNWERYRVDLETYGSKLTGREVAIRGAIQVRLFPWPRLTAEDVAISNPEGFSEPVLAEAERVTVRMALGALLNGVIQVESIDIDKPQLSLERRLDGAVNWHLKPTEKVRNSPLLAHVLLDQIRVNDGTAVFSDARRKSKFVLDRVNSGFSAPSLAGPWRSQGSFAFNALPLTYTVTTSAWDAAKPLNFGARVSSAEKSGYSYAVDGAVDAAGVKGTLGAQPMLNAEGKTDTEGQFRMVTVKAKFAGDFSAVEFSDAEIRPADAKDQGTLITGGGRIAFDENVKASVAITAPRVDLDALAGAGARTLLRDGGGLSLINGLLARLPKGIELDAKLVATALRAGGEMLEDAKLSFSATPEAVRIAEASASMPGRSKARFQGVFFPGAGYSELGGTLALETFDARALTRWLWPEGKAALAKNWTGSRGHLKAQADVSLTSSKLDFQNIAYELDGERGRGRFTSLVNGERPILEVKLNAERLDLDSFLSGGMATLSVGQGVSWSGLLRGFVAEQSQRDMRLVVEAARLHLNGVEADKVKFEADTTVKGFELKALEVGSVGGASVTGSGLFLNGDNGADGSIAITVAASDSKAFMRLAGVLPRDRDPRWTRALGATQATFTVKARADGEPGQLEYAAEGKSGGLTFASSGAFTAVQGLDIGIKGKARVASQSSDDFAILLGLDSPSGGPPADVALTAEGSLGSGLAIDVKASAFGAQATYTGRFHPSTEYFGVDGGWGLDAADARTLAATLRVPGAEQAAGALSLKGKVKGQAAEFTLTEMTGNLGGRLLRGKASLDRDRRLTADLGLREASLAALLAPAFLPWDGMAPSLSQVFPAAWPFGITGEVWVRPDVLDIYPGLNVGGAEVGVTADEKGVQFAAYAKTPSGEKIAFEVNAVRGAGIPKLSGQIALPLDLAKTLMLPEGRPIAHGTASFDVKYEGEGRSPAGVLASLKGQGTFSWVNGKLVAVSPERFTATINQAKTAEGLRASLDAIRGGGAGVEMKPIFGSIAFDEGVGRVTPLTTATVDAEISIAPVIDLPNERVEITVGLALKALPTLPPMKLVYAGERGELQAHEEAAELSSYLGFKVLAKGVDDLEKVQAEQGRLALEEERLRKEDEEKLQAFYAQRAELRLRQRELRIHAAQRVIDKAKADAELARLVEQGAIINRAEIRQRLRELKIFKQQRIGVIAKPQGGPEL
jgi:uncharacterized protein involved in outer membrane biogenesis